jgi:thiol-disulfide isomerase/thioredoxin
LLSQVPAQATKAKNFNLRGVSSTVNLGNYRGRVVYLDFWASWCTPCRKSFPWMNAMQKQYGKYGFDVVAVNLDENRELANQFLKQTPANFTVAFDPSGKTAESYSVDVMPSSFLIDRKGELVAIHKGFRTVDSAALEKEIRQLLARK